MKSKNEHKKSPSVSHKSEEPTNISNNDDTTKKSNSKVSNHSLPFGFIFNHSGFYYWLLDSEGKRKNVYLCNFEPYILKNILYDNGQDQERFFHVGAIRNDGLKLPIVKIKANEFEQMKWLLQHWGTEINYDVGIKIKDRIRQAFINNAMKHNIQEEKVFSHTGFRYINDQLVYLHGNGAIGGKVRTEFESEKLNSYAFHDQELLLSDALKDTFECLEVAKHSVTMPLLSMIFLSPLCEIAKQTIGTMPNFSLWVIGGTGERKSTIVSLLMNHLGNFTSGESLPFGFNSTWYSMEKFTFLLKDTILVVDDYYPNGSRYNQETMKHFAEQLISSYGDRSARERLNPDGSLKKSYQAKGLCIATGEFDPDTQQSRSARYISTHIEKFSVDLEKLLLLQNNQTYENLNFVGRKYIEWIIENIEEVKRLLSLFPDERKALGNVLKDYHGRTIENTTWLLMGIRLFTEFCVNVGYFDRGKQLQFYELARMEFYELAKNHAEKVKGADPVMKFIEALKDLEVSEKIAIHKIKASEVVKEYLGEFVGYQDQDTYYLKVKLIIDEVKKYYDKDVSFIVTQKSLLEQLHNKGLIKDDHITLKNGKIERRVKKKRIDNKNDWYLHLDKKAVNELLEIE